MYCNSRRRLPQSGIAISARRQPPELQQRLLRQPAAALGPASLLAAFEIVNPCYGPERTSQLMSEFIL
jgi:hypothetical protein